MKRGLWLLLMLSLLVPAAAARDYTVIQKGRAFHPDTITIHVGDTIKFANDDQFLHQIYVDSSAIAYDSREQPPGEVLSTTFPVAGTFKVRCHIHPKMLLIVHVK